jgi:predicted membrane protein
MSLLPAPFTKHGLSAIQIVELLLLQMIANLLMFRGARFNMGLKAIGMITRDGELRFQMGR